MLKDKISPSLKIGGLWLSFIYDLPPICTSIVVLLADFGITCLFMIIEGIFPWDRNLYSSFLYNDTLVIPAYCYIAASALRTLDVRRGFYTSHLWHIAILVLTVTTSIALEVNAVRIGQYSISQELSPSKLWHTIIFGVVGYWLLSPIFPILFSRPSTRTTFAILALVVCFFVPVYLDTSMPLNRKVHLEGSYYPWRWSLPR